jgi:hypothetical protein
MTPHTRRRRRFVFTYEPDGQIQCTVCKKRSRMVPELDGEITREVVDHYMRTHKCGPVTDPWGLQPVS